MACGVFALVLMGALSEHFRLLTAHFADPFDGRLYVCEKLSFWAGGGLIDEDRAAEAARVDGVSAVVPVVMGRLESNRLVVAGIPFTLVGVPPREASQLWRGGTLSDGRWLNDRDDDHDSAVLGSDVAYAFQVRCGERIHVLERDFLVVGVLAHAGALEDRQMLVGLRTGQRALRREGLLTSLMVTPSAGAPLEALATSLGAALRPLTVVTPSQLAHEAAQSTRLWRALVLACGLIAALTGSLCIVVTMTVAVTERTHEIGLKRAIGASAGQVTAEIMREAGLLAAIGWTAGVAAAATFVWAWNQGFRREGLLLFALTPRVLALSAACALLLGLMAGALPALSAARLDPVAALRRRG